ncbi:UNVERIFIED_CONTAM: hypothetical protein RMT77_013413 [Armadillidium vulgare]
MFIFKSNPKDSHKLMGILGVCFLVLSLSALCQSVTIMSVDFGSEWLKIAVVAPGIPMEIALNHESKRKTPAAISFRNGERSFGEDALSAGMKSPANSYAYLLDLLGKKVDNPAVEMYKKHFPFYKIESDPERGTILFRHDDETAYSVEELVAQILDYAREIAVAYTNQKTKDIVITVPPFFNQAERRALLAAAELAGLKVLSIISTNAAVALNYGMFRRKEINETAQNILFYDMGASFTTATIASYQTVKTKDRGYSETNPQVSVLGVGYDRSLGGLEMQLRVRDFLGRKFNEMKKTSNNVFESPRGMSKLMKEAAKVKNVLSANTEYISQVEGVLDDQDFRLIVKREEFEELCGDLFERVREPVDSALIAAGMDIKDIHQFIIVGGNTRVPKVQSILQEIWGKELGKNINADEAAALGAVYRAADIGQGFKVMKFHVKESVVYPIDVDFERIIEKEDGTSSSKIVKRNLFALTNTYPQKKVMTFNKHNSDFGFSINYGDLSQLSKEQAGFLGSQNVSFVFVEGVTNAFSKHSEDGAEPKGIKAHFTMDESGILLLTDTEVVFEKNVTVEVEEEEESTFSKIGSTLSKLFSGNEDDSENLVNSTSDSSSENLNKSTNGDESSSKEGKRDEGKADDKNAKKKRSSSKEVKPKLVTVKEPVNFTINFLDIKPFSPENKKASIEKIQSINELENERKEKERMKNTLETYILDIHDKLSQEEYERASEEQIRTDTMKLASQLEEWLYDEGYDETPSTYKDRLKSLEVLFEPIKKRVLEHRQRPEALKALHDMINASSMFMYNAQNSPNGEKWFTDVELKTLDNLIINTQKWLEEKEEEQDNLELYKNPVLSIRSIFEKIDSMDREVKYMINKAKITKAKREREAAEAKREREAAEAKLKEAQEKARAEKEARKKKNKTDEEEEIETEAESEAEVENGNGGEDSRQEPSMPVEDEDIEKEQIEEPEGQPEENESEQNRRKTSENLGDGSSSESQEHTEL